MSDDEVTVRVSVPKLWFRLAQNSIVSFAVAALTGVSLTFAPLGLYFLGGTGAGLSDWRVIACALVVYLIPGFYMVAGGRVMRVARKQRGKRANDDA